MRRTFVRICLETKALSVQEHCTVAIQKQSLDEADTFMSEVTFDIDGLPPIRCKAANSKNLFSKQFKRRSFIHANSYHKSY